MTNGAQASFRLTLFFSVSLRDNPTKNEKIIFQDISETQQSAIPFFYKKKIGHFKSFQNSIGYSWMESLCYFKFIGLKKERLCHKNTSKYFQELLL